MANQITIHELVQTTEVVNTDELAVDNGEVTRRIRVDDFLESSKVNEYKEAAEDAAEAAGDAADLAVQKAEEIDQQFETALGYVQAAREYSQSAEANAVSANNAATTAARAASDADNSADNAAASEENAASMATLAESFAHGQTGSRAGESTDNALFFSSMSQTAAENAQQKAYEAGLEAQAAMSAMGQAQQYVLHAGDIEQEVESLLGQTESARDTAEGYKDAAAASAQAAADAAITEIQATVDSGTGLPSVDVTDISSGNDKKFKLDFHNLKGDSGISAQTSGWFSLGIEGEGDVYAYYPDSSDPPPLEVDEQGNIYYVTDDEDEEV